jgi:hypothetical protein
MGLIGCGLETAEAIPLHIETAKQSIAKPMAINKIVSTLILQ